MWPIGHAWAGLLGKNDAFLHIECTTPGASPRHGGIEEAVYRARIKQAGGLEEIDGSHGPVSSVGVRQHHPACYNPWAAYTPCAMYTAHSGVLDVCWRPQEATGMSAYYNKVFTKVKTPAANSNGPDYEHGAHRPSNQGGCSYNHPGGVYLDTPSLFGEDGLHAFARFKCDDFNSRPV